MTQNQRPALRILVAEDEPVMAQMLALHLRHDGYTPLLAADGGAARRGLFADPAPHLALLDWMLPVESGLDLTRAIRASYALRHLPVILLTARSGEEDRVQGLDCGADDYLTKPFSMKELLARIRALLRRRGVIANTAEPIQTAATKTPSTAPQALRFAEDGSALLQGEPIKLDPLQLRLLSFLHSESGKTQSRERILERVWGEEKPLELRSVDVYVGRLREALGHAGCWIETVRGAGYRLTLPAKISPVPEVATSLSREELAA